MAREPAPLAPAPAIPRTVLRASTVLHVDAASPRESDGKRPRSLEPKGSQRMEPRRLAGGNDAEDDAHEHGDRERDRGRQDG